MYQVSSPNRGTLYFRCTIGWDSFIYVWKNGAKILVWIRPVASVIWVAVRMFVTLGECGSIFLRQRSTRGA